MLKDNEIQVAVSILEKLRPGKLPLSVFLQTTRLTVTPIIEIVPLRKRKDNKVEILLTERDDTDPNWPGMVHTPGTVVRSTDSEGSYEDAFKRILEDELKGVQTSKPIFVGNLLHKVKRGLESCIVYWVEVSGKPPTGKFYRFDNLPKNLVDTQIKFINLAVKHFQDHNK